MGQERRDGVSGGFPEKQAEGERTSVILDLDLFAAGFPHDAFTRLRREAPVWWHPPSERAPGGEGFWVVSRHREAVAVLRDPETFSSEGGGARAGGGTTLADVPRGSGLLIFMDPPRHTRLRLLVQPGFRPGAVARLEPELRRRAGLLLDAAVRKGECDFVADVAAELPLQAVCGLLGIPAEDRHRLFEWANAMVDYADRELTGLSERFRAAIEGLTGYGRALLARRRSEGGDDVFGQLVAAEGSGAAARPSEAELLAFFQLLFIAGSETTRNAIAHGLHALLEQPDELARLRAEPGLMASAVEEILRWTSPTSYNRRTAVRDAELCGQRMRAGDKVTVWYPSANRDEEVFAEPFRFDVGRDPNPHLAFGFGAHHCLGAALARTEIRVLFEELLARVASVERAGAVEWARSNKHQGVRRLPVRLHPA
jgi:cytochrome P450